MRSKGCFLFFTMIFFLIRKSAQRYFCIQLNKKQKKTCVWHTQGHERGGRPSPLGGMCGTFLRPKIPFTVSQEAPSCPLPVGAADVSVNGLVCLQLTFLFFFPFVSLSSFENYSLALLVVGISTSVLILLIFDFFDFGPFLFIYLQFHYLIPIYQILYSLIRSSFVGFLILCLGFFVKVLWVSISSFNSNRLYYIFHFAPHID